MCETSNLLLLIVGLLIGGGFGYVIAMLNRAYIEYCKRNP